MQAVGLAADAEANEGKGVSCGARAARAEKEGEGESIGAKAARTEEEGEGKASLGKLLGNTEFRAENNAAG